MGALFPKVIIKRIISPVKRNKNSNIKRKINSKKLSRTLPNIYDISVSSG